MSYNTEDISIWDKVVISTAILAAIVGLFKAGPIAAILKFFFVIVFLTALKVLVIWIFTDNQ